MFYFGKNLRLADLHRLCNSLHETSKNGLSEDQMLMSVLKDFSSQNGNSVTINVNSNNVATVINITSNHMKNVFKLFPEVVMVDATTYNTNKNRYKLFSFMIHDSFGKGQHVQHSLMEREDKLSIEKACIHFKENQSDWENIKVIVCDKDFNEIEVMKKNFPKARILLCQFHVLKWIQKILYDEKFGDLGTDLRKRLYGAFYIMVYAADGGIYDKVSLFT